MTTISRYDAYLAAASAMVIATGEDSSDAMEDLNDSFNDRGATVSHDVVDGKITFTVTFPDDMELDEDDDEDDDED